MNKYILTEFLSNSAPRNADGSYVTQRGFLTCGQWGELDQDIILALLTHNSAYRKTKTGQEYYKLVEG